MKFRLMILSTCFFVEMNAQISQEIEASFLAYTKINHVRRAKQLDTLLWNQSLDSCSLLHAKEMAIHNFFSHTNPFNINLKTSSQRVLLYGYKYKMIAENIAFYETSVNNIVSKEFLVVKFVDNWLKSKGHYKNIMNKEYKETGLNIIKFIDKSRVRYYAVQNFGVR